MNINVKRITISRRVIRPSLDWLYLAIAAGLRWVNRNYDDYDIRELMGELTRDEARAVILAEKANAEQCDREIVAQSGIWHGGE